MRCVRYLGCFCTAAFGTRIGEIKKTTLAHIGIIHLNIGQGASRAGSGIGRSPVAIRSSLGRIGIWLKIV